VILSHLRPPARRRFQKPAHADAIPALLRVRLDRVGGTNLADRFRREEILDAYRPKLAIALTQDYLSNAGDAKRLYHVPEPLSAAGTRVTDSWWEAFKNLKATHATLQTARVDRAYDEQEISDHAENYARLAGAMARLEDRIAFAVTTGINVEVLGAYEDAGIMGRLADPKWWRRQLRVHWRRRAENTFRDMGIVRKRREPYASDDAVQAHTAMRKRGRRFLENHVCTNEAGEQLPLVDLADSSLANPAIRRAEFMTRVSGFERIAKDAGHVAQFWTLTTPSAFHAWRADGEKNPNYERQRVRDGQAWLCKMWGRVRAKLKRLSILVYGFRIAEPHHDATPHWHLLIFCRPRDAETIERVVRGHWLKEFPNEEGAQKYRAKCIAIDDTKGSAAGYVAKYVSKNIDAAGAIGEGEDEETGRAVVDSVRRVHAWASVHGIRQFQQIGGPPVGLWRELRRLTEVSRDDGIELARARADAGDWAGFIRALSFDGIRAGRKVPLKLVKESTGELSDYGEEKAPAVVGVRLSSRVEVTRSHVWRIQKCGTIAPDVSELLNLKKCGTYAFHEIIAKPALNPDAWPSLRKRIEFPPGVMNPPRRAARRREAGNPIAQAAAETAGRQLTRPRGTYPATKSGAAGPAAPGFFPTLDLFSDLGPVAIIVRSAGSPVASGAASPTGPPEPE
jgi:hypothetical protein